MRQKHIAVLGAGIVGVGVASYLQRDGHRVTLIDQDEPGSGASSGNAGLIQCAAVVPIATPHTIRAVPTMLLDPEQPLVVRWRNLPSLMPYLLGFLREATPGRAERNSRALATIVPRAFDAFRPLIAAAGIQEMISECGELYVYETDSAFQGARYAFEMRLDRGVRVDFISGDEARELEPALAPAIRHGVFLPESYLTTDPGRFTQALAAQFGTAGGTFLKSRVDDLRADDDGKVVVSLTGAEPLIADEAVVAFGAFSKPWVQKLGSRVPLDSERGYHMMLPKPGVTLRRCLLSGEYRFAISPLGGGIRLGGTAELARVGAPPNYDRARRLFPLAQRVLPGLGCDGHSVWMGHRPSTPDSVPVIGRSPVHPNIYYAFGHGHLGLTLGAMTGKLIADLTAGRDPGIDMSPFSIERFARPGRVEIPPPLKQSQGETDPCRNTSTPKS